MRRLVVVLSLAVAAVTAIAADALAQSSMGVPPTMAVQRAHSHTTQPPSPSTATPQAAAPSGAAPAEQEKSATAPAPQAPAKK